MTWGLWGIGVPGPGERTAAHPSTYEADHPLGQIAANHPNVDLHAWESPQGIKVNMIQVAPEHQGKGYAGAALRDLISYADAQGLPIALTPGIPEGRRGMSQAALKRWYSSHGFVPNKGRNKDWNWAESMIRPARDHRTAMSEYGGPRTVYRGIALRSSDFPVPHHQLTGQHVLDHIARWMPKMYLKGEKPGLGGSWTLRRSLADEATHRTGYDLRAILTAEVDDDSIDHDATARNNSHFPSENEITVRRGHPVRVTGIDITPHGQVPQWRRLPFDPATRNAAHRTASYGFQKGEMPYAGGHRAEAFDPDTGETVGYLEHDRDSGEVSSIWVHPDHRGRGIATDLFDWTRKYVNSRLRHSDDLTDEGRAWAESMGHDTGNARTVQWPTAHRTAMPTWYHLTYSPDFRLDPGKVPTNYNYPDAGAGVFLTQRPHEWADNEWGEDRGYIADIDAPEDLHTLPGARHDPDSTRPTDRFPGSDEIFVPADQFHHLTVNRVRPRTAMPAQSAPWRRTPEGHHVWESDKGAYRVSPHLTSRTSGGWRIDYPEGGWRRARSAGDAKELAYRHYLGDPDWAAPADENMGRLEKRGLPRIGSHDENDDDEWEDDYDEYDDSFLFKDWYHASPHKLPIGTTLVPGGGESPFEGQLSPRDLRERGGYVWVTDDLDDAHSWRDFIQSGTEKPVYMYRVQPNTPPVFDDDDTGHSTSSAVVKELVHDPTQPKKEARTMSAAVTVYTQPNCVQCTMTKKQLDKLGIEHSTVDVSADPEAHAYVTGLGYTAAPVVVVNDGEDHWAGFKPDRLKALSGE